VNAESSTTVCGDPRESPAIWFHGEAPAGSKEPRKPRHDAQCPEPMVAQLKRELQTHNIPVVLESTVE